LFQSFKHKISSISHQQAVAEHWDLPNTEIFQSKDVASGEAIETIMPPLMLYCICAKTICTTVIGNDD
jgi:hypothetical protein